MVNLPPLTESFILATVTKGRGLHSNVGEGHQNPVIDENNSTQLPHYTVDHAVISLCHHAILSYNMFAQTDTNISQLFFTWNERLHIERKSWGEWKGDLMSCDNEVWSNNIIPW